MASEAPLHCSLGYKERGTAAASPTDPPLSTEERVLRIRSCRGMPNTSAHKAVRLLSRYRFLAGAPCHQVRWRYPTRELLPRLEFFPNHRWAIVPTS